MASVSDGCRDRVRLARWVTVDARRSRQAPAWIAGLVLLVLLPCAGAAQGQSRARKSDDDSLFQTWANAVQRKSHEFAAEQVKSGPADFAKALRGNEARYAACIRARIADTPAKLKDQVIAYLNGDFRASKTRALIPAIYADYWTSAQQQCVFAMAPTDDRDRAADVAPARSPHVVTMPDPADYYPKAALKERATGRTVARCALNADGRAADCEIETSSGFAALDAATLRVIADMRWEAEARRPVMILHLPIRWTVPD